jgi:hypothetical protein
MQTHCQDRCHHILNIAYPCVVIALLIIGYILQFASCLSRDHPPYIVPSGFVPLKNCSEAEEMSSRQLKVCNNPVSTYVLSDILHFLSYLYAFYVFRWCENEELSTTMEKV